MQLDHLAAWRHFYATFKYSTEWHALSPQEKNRLILADKDSRCERFKKSGTKINLGFGRVEKLLNKHAPGRYTVVRVLAFEVVQ
jgi:hypothetical protein